MLLAPGVRKRFVQSGIRQRSLGARSRFGRATELVFVLAAGSLLALGGPAQAQTWDGGGADADWNTSGNWDPNGVPAAGASPTVTGAGGGNANPTISANTNNYTVTTISGGTVTANAALNSLAVTVSSNGTLTIGASGEIRGNASVDTSVLLLGNGTLTNNGTLTGSLSISGGTVNNAGVVANGTSISGGTLNLNAGTNLANGEVLTVIGGIVNVNATDAIGGLAGGPGGNIVFTAGNGLTITNTSPATSTYSGAISGATTAGTTYILKTGSGTQTLSGNNTTTGGGAVRVDGGTLVLTGGNAVGNNNVLETTSGTVNLQAAETVGGLLGLATGTLQLNGNTLTITGVTGVVGAISLGNITGTGGLIINSAGFAQQFVTALDYTGDTTITAGTLGFGANDILNDATDVTLNGGTLNLATFSDTVTSVSLQSGTINGTGTLTSGSTFDVQSGTVNARLGGAVGLNKTTAGTVTLTGANTYTGTTSVTGGTLAVTGAGALASGQISVNGGTLSTDSDALADTADIEVLNSGTWTTAGTDTVGDVTLTLGTINGSGTITAATYTQTGGTLAAGVTVNAAGPKTLSGGTIAGTLGGAGATTVQTGTTTLTGTINGGTTVTSGGILSVAGGSVTGNLTLAGGTLRATSDTTLSPTSLRFEASTANTVRAETGDTLTLTPVGVNLDFNSVTTFGSATDTGTVVLNTDTLTVVTGSDVVVAGGTLRTNSASMLSSSGGFLSGRDITVETGATLDLTGTTHFVSNLAGGGTVTRSVAGVSTITVESLANSTFSGVIQDGAGTMALTKTSGGTLTLSGANTYTGTTTVNAGRLDVTGSIASTVVNVSGSGGLTVDGSSLADTAVVTLSNSANLTVSGGNEVIGALNGVGTTTLSLTGSLTTGGANTDTTFAGVASGAGGLTKAGTGTFTLSGANTYTGATRVEGGTLAVTGSIAGNVTVDGTGRLRIGNSDAIGGSITTTGSVVSYANGVNEASALILSSATTQLEVLGTDAATQSGVISSTGAFGFEKIGTGTLTLTATNTYSGATTVSAGVLAVTGSIASTTITVTAAAAGGASLSVDGAALDDSAGVTLNGFGNLTLTGSETIGLLAGATGSSVTLGANTLTTGGNGGSANFGGDIGGTGGLTKTGAGTLALNAANSFTGTLAIEGGTVALNGTGSLAAALVTVGSGTTFGIDGSRSVNALQNSGTVDLSDGAADDVLTVSGTYTGGGTVALDTVLGGDGSASDRLVITGAATGVTTLVITNIGGTGAATANGIRVVETGSSTAGAFVLGAPLSAGGFTYSLSLNTADQDWYLVTGLTAGSAAFTNAPIVLRYAYTRLDSYDARLAARLTGAAAPDGSRAWARVAGERLDLATTTPGTAGVSQVGASLTGLEAGLDLAPVAGGSGDWVIGLSAGVSDLGADVTVDAGLGRVDGSGLFVAGSATWLGDGGTYVDLQARVTRIDADLSAGGALLVENTSLTAFAAGVEVGRSFALGQGQSLTPFGQLGYGSLSGGSFTGSDGTVVDLGDTSSAQGRLGLTWRSVLAGGGQIYASGRVEHQFDPAATATVDGLAIEAEAAATWAAVELGGSFKVAEGMQGFGAVSYAGALDAPGTNEALSARAGFTLRW
jgi:outer membrane autotransporter protein